MKMNVTALPPGIDRTGADMGPLLDEAKAAFVDWAKQAMIAARSAAPGLAGDGFAAAREIVATAFHDMKGGGGSVGFDLLSRIGASACDLLDRESAPSQHAVRAANAHIVAAEGVLAAGIEGDGGAAGVELIDKLGTLAR